MSERIAAMLAEVMARVGEAGQREYPHKLYDNLLAHAYALEESMNPGSFTDYDGARQTAVTVAVDAIRIALAMEEEPDDA